MIFPVAESERTVQVGDKTRLLGVKSYVVKGEDRISKVEICPDYLGEPVAQPFSITFSGEIQYDGSITNIQDDFSQVQTDMVITSAVSLDPSQTATVASIDVPNKTIYTSGALVTNTGPDTFTITGTVMSAPPPVFINVNGQDERDWYLDWAYEGTTRNVTFAVRVSTDTTSQVASKVIRVLSPEDDLLFSTDDDLKALEPDLSRYVPDGRSTFLNVHREAKAKILESLSDEGIRNADNTPLTASILKDVTEVRTWSRDLTLALIFQGSINEAGDVFSQKADYYRKQAVDRQDRAYLTLTVPVNGSTEPYRSSQVQTASLSR